MWPCALSSVQKVGVRCRIPPRKAEQGVCTAVARSVVRGQSGRVGMAPRAASQGSPVMAMRCSGGRVGGVPRVLLQGRPVTDRRIPALVAGTTRWGARSGHCAVCVRGPSRLHRGTGARPMGTPRGPAWRSSCGRQGRPVSHTSGGERRGESRRPPPQGRCQGGVPTPPFGPRGGANLGRHPGCSCGARGSPVAAGGWRGASRRPPLQGEGPGGVPTLPFEPRGGASSGRHPGSGRGAWGSPTRPRCPVSMENAGSFLCFLADNSDKLDGQVFAIIWREADANSWLLC